MAKISITDDQGSLIEQFTDDAEEIGDITRAMARSCLMDEIARAVHLAHKADKRNEQGEPKV